VPFVVKSDYLCLRYGDKRIIVKGDADAAIVVDTGEVLLK